MTNNISSKELILLAVLVIASLFIIQGIYWLLTHYLLKRCIKCFHLLDKNGNCKYCQRERDYDPKNYE